MSKRKKSTASPSREKPYQVFVSHADADKLNDLDQYLNELASRVRGQDG